MTHKIALGAFALMLLASAAVHAQPAMMDSQADQRFQTMDRMMSDAQKASGPERHKQMQAHMKAMQEQMQNMRPMMQGMQSPGQGGTGMGMSSGAGPDMSQMQQRMDMMQRMMEQMLKHDEMMLDSPAR